MKTMALVCIEEKELRVLLGSSLNMSQQYAQVSRRGPVAFWFLSEIVQPAGLWR